MESLPLEPAIRKVLFEASVDGLFLLEDGRILEANSNAARILGEETTKVLVNKPLLWWFAAPSNEVRQALLGDHTSLEQGAQIQLPGEETKYTLSLFPMSEGSSRALARLQEAVSDRPDHAEPGPDSLFRLVLDSIPIGVFWKDRDLRFVGCNQQFAKDAGLRDPSEVIGRTDEEMPWTKADAEAYIRDDRQVMEEDAPRIKITERQSRADGTHAWVETNKVPMHDAEGNVIGILGSYEDITEQKNAELTLKEFSDGLHMMAQATADKSGQEFFESCVRAMAHLLGASTTLIGIHDADKEGVLKLKALWSGGQLVDGQMLDLIDSPLSEVTRTLGLVAVNADVRSYHPDNKFLEELKAESFIGLPITLPGGEICGFFCALDRKARVKGVEQVQPILELFAGRIAVELERSWAMEALERKINSAGLLESISSQIRASFDPDEILQSAITRLGDGLEADRCLILSYHLSPRPELVLTAEHVAQGIEGIDDWNVRIEGEAFFEALLAKDDLLAVDSLESEPLIGGALREFLTDLDVQSLVAVRTSYQNQTNGILFLQQCQGSRQWSTDEKDLIKTVADMIGIALGQARMFENERLQRHELARKNRALAKAKTDADSANHAKSEFLSRMSHELRTPLNAILGFAQVMERDAMATDQQKQNLNTITRSGSHLLEMINDVLEMSRIEAGQVSIEPTSFNLEELLDSVVSMFQTRAHPGVKLKLGISPTVPMYARTDEVKLRQILINLFGNAVKFTQEGEVALRVRAEQRYPEGVCSAWNLIASVHDTGPGIHEDEAGALFQAFTQTESGQNIQQGTGLGLPISRQFARLLGGDISVQSSPGKGTIFSLKIPCGEANPAELDDRRLAQNQRARGLAPRQIPPKILIVDDHQESRVWLEMLLGSIGLPSQTAANGAEALKMCQLEVPDIVFMDIHMPVMDGDTAAGELRKTLGDKTPLLVALTASAFVRESDRVTDGPFDHFLPKPVHEKRLIAIFEKHLGVQFDYGEESLIDEATPDFHRQLTPTPVSKPTPESEIILQPLELEEVELEPESEPEVVIEQSDPEAPVTLETPSEAVRATEEEEEPELSLPAKEEPVIKEKEVTPAPIMATEVDEAPPEEAPKVELSPTTQAICDMPESWLDQMLKASECLNLNETRDLLLALKEEHPIIARPLQKWCEDYQFEKLQSELKLAREQRHASC